MGTNDLYTKDIGSAIGLGRLRHPAGGATSSGWQARRRQLLPVLVDILTLVVAGVATEALSHMLGDPAPPVAWVAFFGILVIGLFAGRGMYSERLTSHLLDEIRTIVSTTAVATMAVISLRVVFADDPHTSAQTAQTWVLAAVALSG